MHAAMVEEAERVLGDIGDFEIHLPGPDGSVRRVLARDALIESRDELNAATEFAACIAEAAE